MTKTVYVCPIKGNDKNDGLEESKPVRTIARGRKIAAKIATDEIRIRAGAKSSWITEELAKGNEKSQDAPTSASVGAGSGFTSR